MDLLLLGTRGASSPPQTRSERADDLPSIRENRGPYVVPPGRVFGLGSADLSRPTAHTVARQSRIPTGFPRQRGERHHSAPCGSLQSGGRRRGCAMVPAAKPKDRWTGKPGERPARARHCDRAGQPAARHAAATGPSKRAGKARREARKPGDLPPIPPSSSTSWKGVQRCPVKTGPACARSDSSPAR
jgi:hypothetical protein